MAENTKKTNEKMMCEEHNVETYEACAECGKPICIMCKTFQYEEVFPKKVHRAADAGVHRGHQRLPIPGHADHKLHRNHRQQNG